jgi:hypothetical protein
MNNKDRINLFRNVTDGYKERSKYVNTNNEINLHNDFKNFFEHGGSMLTESLQRETKINNDINFKNTIKSVPPIDLNNKHDLNSHLNDKL